MGTVTYSLFAYLLTAVISFVVVGIIVGIDRIMSRISDDGKEN